MKYNPKENADSDARLNDQKAAIDARIAELVARREQINLALHHNMLERHSGG